VKNKKISQRRKQKWHKQLSILMTLWNKNKHL
jgi:hypothetical protein